MIANILVIDDDEVMRDSCYQILSAAGYNVTSAENGASGFKSMQRESFDIVLLDMKLPGINGIEILKKIKEDCPETIVIIITAYGTVESAVESMKLGAYDFILKPFTPDELRIIINRSLEKKGLILENEYLRRELQNRLGTEVIIGKSKVMLEICRLIARVGSSDSTVLICGESGTGKELVARAIHKHSLRKDKPFVVVDCGALAESLFESELFGHVKGAFTGALAAKPGRFELSNGGTVFFDEIGNINLNIQGKLLRAIQERETTRVGGTQVTKIDARIISATNKELPEAIQKGTFREDLFYRLNVIPINLPPLRQRKEDIPLLANYLLEEYNKKRKKNIQDISNQAMEMLIHYNWPGNVRELENTIERAVVLTEGSIIKPEHLVYQGLITTTMVKEPSSKSSSHLEEVEKDHIVKALNLFDRNRTHTAQFLGIDRKTLFRKMKRYGVC